MFNYSLRCEKTLQTLFLFVFLSCFTGLTNAQELSGKQLYAKIKESLMNGGKAEVSELVLKRDRVTMVFTGTFYFSTPINGQVTTAVFNGQGSLLAEVPPSDFEKNNVKRLLNAENVESDFKTAILRFSDDTFDIIGREKQEASSEARLQKTVSDNETKILKESGVNISSRLALSMANKEKPGVFFATFEGGKRGRFYYVLDHQNRLLTNYFDINGGEKGAIYSYKQAIFGIEAWTAFYSLDDYKKGVATYSDVNDLVDIQHYEMDIDLRSPDKVLGLKTKVSMSSRFSEVKVLNFLIGESLSIDDGERLKKQLRVKKVQLNDENLEFNQEDWESGFTVFLSKPLKANEQIQLYLEFEGDFIQRPDFTDVCFYPRSNTSWYPRHGYLDRSSFNFTYTHSKKNKIASVGVRESETPSATDSNVVITKYKMTYPVALVTFAMGPFKRHTEDVKFEETGRTIPIEYNSVDFIPIKEDFIQAELNNSIRFFEKIFGNYPYNSFGAVFHPFGFGQGMPSMILIPPADRANKFTFSFIAHETSHQWWGNIVSWRSYRDQWLSEGFAEYSGVLYTGHRQNNKAAMNLIEAMRRSLKAPPITLTGLGKGKLYEVGPLILGHRLNTTKTFGAQQALIYEKGGLVLRMLHFLLMDPTTSDDRLFFEMMKDFVNTYRNQVASTDDFRIIANKHFAKSPIAKKHGLTDLNWFFNQWVYGSENPSYTMTYKYEEQPDGSVVFVGNIKQENVSPDFGAIMPIEFELEGNKKGTVTAVVYGPQSTVKIRLPSRPKKVELDPNKWILSEETTTN